MVVIVAAMAGLTYRAVTAFLIRRELDAARRENAELKARRAALREDAFSLGARATEVIDRGRRLPSPAGRNPVLRAGGQATPSRNAGDDSIISWLSSKGAQLQALAVELSDGKATTGSDQGSAASRDATGAAAATDDAARQPPTSHSAPLHSVGKAAE